MRVLDLFREFYNKHLHKTPVELTLKALRVAGDFAPQRETP